MFEGKRILFLLVIPALLFATGTLSSVAAETRASGPDLAVTYLAVSPSSGQPGAGFDLRCIFSNLGDTTADNVIFRIYYSNDDTISTIGSDHLLVSMEGISIAGGSTYPLEGSSIVSVTLPESAMPGTRYFGIVADPNNYIVESNETNNTRVAAFIVLPQYPDLQVTSLQVVPSIAQPLQDISVTYTVANYGDKATTAGSRLGFYYSSDTTLEEGDTYLSEAAIPSGLAVDASSSDTVVLTLPQAATLGGRYIIAKADFDGSMTESLEDNNARAVGITVTYPSCDDIAADSGDVCSGKGACIGFNTCECEDGYSDHDEGENSDCNLWTCFGEDFDDGGVCNGNGACTAPDTCNCNIMGWSGDECEVNACESEDDWTACGEGVCFSETCERLGENDICAGAETLTIGQTYNGDLKGFHSWEPVPFACVGQALIGPDAFFTFDAEAGHSYRITCPATGDWDMACVVWPDCDLSDKPCEDGLDFDETSDDAMELSRDSAGEVVVQIVGNAPDLSDGDMTFDLRVEDLAAPDGDSDGDAVDGEVPIDGDDTDGDMIDGDDIDGDISDGDESLDGDDTDGDASVDGDTLTDGDIPTIDGDDNVEDGDEPGGVGSSGGGCSHSNGPAGMLLMLGLIAMYILRRKRSEA